MDKLDRLAEYVTTSDNIAEMEHHLATFTLLCSVTSSLILPEGKVWVPLHQELEGAMGRVDQSAFKAGLERAFWMLAVWGLENSASQGLWKDIVTEYERGSHAL